MLFFRSSVAVAALLVATPAFAATAEQDTIVVTAKSLKQTGADLAACLARNCPPDEDVRATLAHAENQFVAGGYKNARTTLLQSVGRNRRHGKAYPVPVSDLLRANGRIAAHLGETDSFQLSTIASRDILKSGVGADDPRTLVGTIEVADMRAKLGYTDEADRIYRQVGERARVLNLPFIAAASEIRGAWLRLESEQADDRKEGRARLMKLAESSDATGKMARLAAKVLLARLDRKHGKMDGTQALLAEYASMGGTVQPTLLAYEPIKLPEVSFRPNDERNVLSQIATKNFDGQWFDVGFWITPDGHVSEVEVIRKNGTEDQWVKPVLASISTRVYAPLKREPGDPGVFAVERYTLTSSWEDRLGTRLRQRSAIPTIERMDLTAEQIAAPPPVTPKAGS